MTGLTGAFLVVLAVFAFWVGLMLADALRPGGGRP